MADGLDYRCDAEVALDRCDDGYDEYEEYEEYEEYDGSLHNDWWGTCDRRRPDVDEVGPRLPPPESSRYALLAGAVAVAALIGLLALPVAATAPGGAPSGAVADVVAGPVPGPEAPLIVALAAENGGPGADVSVTTADPDARAQAAITFAMKQIGIPYVWGGDGPASGEGGFDCSGLTKASYDSAGIDLPRTAHTQFYDGPHVPADAALKPGDLVFYGTPRRVHHVGLHLGGGRMVNAPHTGALVQVASVRWEGDDYLGATRPAAGPGSLITGPIDAVVVPPVPGPTAPVTDEFVAPPAALPPAAAPALPATALPVAPAPAPVVAPAVVAPPAAAPAGTVPAPAATTPPATSPVVVPSPTTPATTPPVVGPVPPSPATTPPPVPSTTSSSPPPPSAPVVVPPVATTAAVTTTTTAAPPSP
jgi:cell wall-associated NlpC family hydrolase